MRAHSRSSRNIVASTPAYTPTNAIATAITARWAAVEGWSLVIALATGKTMNATQMVSATLRIGRDCDAQGRRMRTVRSAMRCAVPRRSGPPAALRALISGDLALRLAQEARHQIHADRKPDRERPQRRPVKQRDVRVAGIEDVLERGR